MGIVKNLICGILVCFVFHTCKSEIEDPKKISEQEESHLPTLSDAGLNCTAQTEQMDYAIYKMCNDGYRIGDVAPFYDDASGNILIYYLKDIWNDGINQRHPIHAFTTNNFYNYTETGEIISSSAQGCDQDFAVGAGSVVKSGSTYYGFYTGHNPNAVSCAIDREGVLLATSTNPTVGFSKNTNFQTINVPKGQGFDENDNFRDPYVFLDNGTYYMLLCARKDVGGTMKGVVIKYTSTDLMNWSYQGVLYDGGATNYWMMETPQVFKIGATYYLLYSDQINKYVCYRKSTSLNGTWNMPQGNDRFEGKGIFAAKTVQDQYGDHYILGWNNILSGHIDVGAWVWGGNLIVHKIYATSNGDLAVTIPHTVKNHLEATNYAIVKNSQWGEVENTIPGTHSYRIVSAIDLDLANVIFEPIEKDRYKISTTLSFASSNKDFGFMIGACDGFNDFYSLRFIPSQNRFSFDKLNRSQLTTTTVAENDVPLNLIPNTEYKIDIVIENSVVVVYINDAVALTNRIYKATNTNWGIFADHSNVMFSNIVVTCP
jgi:beta-fructofuranosidase